MVSRIEDSRCLPRWRSYFLNKLKLNGYDGNVVENLLNQPLRSTSTLDEDVFYLTVPFFGDCINKMLRKALTPIGLNIRISHRGRSLGFTVMNMWKQESVRRCQLARCPMDNIYCHVSKVVYKCTCQNCGAFYIGSTYRALHIRIKEHMNLRNSPIYKHNIICTANPKWNFQVINHCSNVINLRIRESLIISQSQPSLNTKEDFDFFYVALGQ